MYSYMSKLLDKSFWDRKVKYTADGLRAYYSVGLQSNPIPPCDCTLPPHLIGLSMSGKDRFYAWADFNIEGWKTL